MENNKFFFCYSGFCFLEYDSHKSASLAKRRLETGRIKVWSCDIIVDWADPQEEPDQETMNQVNISIPDQLEIFHTFLRSTFELVSTVISRQFLSSNLGELTTYQLSIVGE